MQILIVLYPPFTPIFDVCTNSNLILIHTGGDLFFSVSC